MYKVHNNLLGNISQSRKVNGGISIQIATINRANILTILSKWFRRKLSTDRKMKNI